MAAFSYSGANALQCPHYPSAQFPARGYPRREELGKDERIFLQRVVEIGGREVEDIAGGGDGGEDGQRCGKKGQQSSFRQHDDCVVSGDRGLNKRQDVEGRRYERPEAGVEREKVNVFQNLCVGIATSNPWVKLEFGREEMQYYKCA